MNAKCAINGSPLHPTSRPILDYIQEKSPTIVPLVIRITHKGKLDWIQLDSEHQL